MSDYLPPEVLIEILTRLPVKTLLQCTGVCKSWYYLITNPSFISTHLDRTIANNNSHLVVRHYAKNSEKEHYSLHCDNDTFDEYMKLDIPFKSRNWCFRIIGSSNGLVCLSDDWFSYTHIMILWNPSIRKFVTLPKPNVTFMSHGAFQHSIGFGFHPETNDYKIMRVVYLQEALGDKIPPEVELYELSTGSWRSISAGDFAYVIEERDPQALLNGVAHWIGYNPNGVGGSFYNLIVSFDMDDEVFGTIMVPDSVADQRWPRSMRVVVFGESLSLIHHTLSKG